MHASVRRVECPLCGSYRLADSAFASTINKNEVLEHIHQLSGLLRNFNARSPTNETLEVDGRMMTSWDAVLKSAPIPIPDDLDIVAKADAVMHAIRGRCDGHLNYGLVCEQDTAYAIGFCHDAAEFHYLLEFAKEQDWFTHGCRRKYPDPTRRYELRLTPKGWARLTGVDDRVLDQGFIAMSFSKDLLPLRDNGLKPGIESAGYKALRIDRKEHNNRIDDEMIAEIRKSRFLVADLTNQNQGAYFEAGFAKGLGKEVVWTCEQTEVDEKKVHFDTRQYSIVTWSKDGYPDFAKRLAHRIEATLDRGHYHPPEHSSKTSATIP
jgi:nucleoside 2-deoxyribosyltransferase